jgi:hypothetical protein
MRRAVTESLSVMKTSEACDFRDGQRAPDREMAAAGKHANADGKVSEAFAIGPSSQRGFIEL